MINWILTNKDWIFSGVGIAIITILFSFIFKKRKGIANTDKSVSDGFRIQIFNVKGNIDISELNNAKHTEVAIEQSNPRFKNASSDTGSDENIMTSVPNRPVEKRFGSRAQDFIELSEEMLTQYRSSGSESPLKHASSTQATLHASRKQPAIKQDNLSAVQSEDVAHHVPSELVRTLGDEGDMLNKLLSSGIHAIAFSPDGRLLASAEDLVGFTLWEVSSGCRLQTVLVNVCVLAFSPDSQLLITGGYHKTIKLWEVSTYRELSSFGTQSLFLTTSVTSVAFSPDGRLLATGDQDNAITFWEVASGRVVFVLKKAIIDSGMAFSPDGKMLASSYHGISLWDVSRGKELRSLSGHSGVISCLAFSPNGKQLASASWNKTIKVWDLANGRELHKLTGHSKEVNSVSFSNDGRLLASGSKDKTIKLWDVTSGRELRTLTGHTKGVSSVAFFPKARLLASGSADNTIKLWQ